jgi:hypothetical protein
MFGAHLQTLKKQARVADGDSVPSSATKIPSNFSFEQWRLFKQILRTTGCDLKFAHFPALFTAWAIHHQQSSNFSFTAVSNRPSDSRSDGGDQPIRNESEEADADDVHCWQVDSTTSTSDATGSGTAETTSTNATISSDGAATATASTSSVNSGAITDNCDWFQPISPIDEFPDSVLLSVAWLCWSLESDRDHSIKIDEFNRNGIGRTLDAIRWLLVAFQNEHLTALIFEDLMHRACSDWRFAENLINSNFMDEVTAFVRQSMRDKCVDKCVYSAVCLIDRVFLHIHAYDHCSRHTVVNLCSPISPTNPHEVPDSVRNIRPGKRKLANLLSVYAHIEYLQDWLPAIASLICSIPDLITASSASHDIFFALSSIRIALSHVYVLAFSSTTSLRLELCADHFESLADAAVVLADHLQSDEALNTDENMQTLRMLLDVINVR